LHTHLCICAALPTLELSTRVVIVQHVKERQKPTNTARLAHRMLAGSRIIHFPPEEGIFDASPLEDPDVDYDVVFPRDDAVTLTPDIARAKSGRERCYVVLDGTWRQCSRMSRRVPRVRDLRCLALPPGAPSIWGMRRQHDPRGLCTMEAIIRLLEMTEGPDAVAPLNRAFQTVAARMLYMKGRLRTPEIPESWPR
jgi:DTW domain-containing protein YfiP